MKIFTSKQNLYLSNTEVENLFISEYMIPADGLYVKVWLLAKMYLESGASISNESIARYLGTSKAQVLDAWHYWETKGVVHKHVNGPDPEDFDVEFVCLKELMFAGERKTAENSEAAALKGSEDDSDSPLDELNRVTYSPALLDLFSKVEQKVNRTLNSSEIKEVSVWHDEMGLTSDVILKAYDICINERKKKPTKSYVGSIVKSWYKKGLFDKEKLDTYLYEHDKRHNYYKRIFRALGFVGRFPTEEEQRIMDSWFDEYNLDISTILEACKKTSGISNPSINYINAILKSWHDEGKITASGKPQPTMSQIKKLYEEIRAANQSEEESRKKQVYSDIPRIEEIDRELAELNPKRIQLLVSGQKKSSIYSSMETEMKNLRLEKQHLLENAGLSADYLSPIYTCKVCKDTGFLENGEKCVCLAEKLL